MSEFSGTRKCANFTGVRAPGLLLRSPWEVFLLNYPQYLVDNLTCHLIIFFPEVYLFHMVIAPGIADEPSVHIVLLHPVLVGHFGWSIDIVFTGPQPQDSTEPKSKRQTL